MADTAIEWADRVWNPTSGCDRVSLGCDHCYALTMAKRLKGMGSAKYQRDGDPRTSGPGFGVSVHPDALTLPLKWRKPQRIFVNSMSDLFHDQVPDEYIARTFAVMSVAHQHTFQVLTKRHARMRSLLNNPAFREEMGWYATGLHPYWTADDAGWPLPNVWLGVSAENQQWADIRIPALLDTPAAVRFVSAEPLLGPITLRAEWLWSTQSVNPPTLSWVITGGESGPGARPTHPDWFRSIRDQCQAAGVAYLHKQHGEWIEDITPFGDGTHRLNIPPDHKSRTRCAMHPAGMTALTPDNPFNPFREGHPNWTAMRRVGKHRAGRELDGRTWDEYPQAVTHG